MEQKCKYCNKGFETNRTWKKFCCKKHQQEYWKEVYSGRLSVSKRLEKLEKKLGIE